jgi:hypothetical protein
MLELSECMKVTLAKLTVECTQEGPVLDEFPSQVLCLAEAVNYTTDVEKAITHDKLSELQSNLKHTLEELTSEETYDKLSRLKVQTRQIIRFIRCKDSHN